ncbi:MAG TPA: secretin and TonB N-terminal domain-containing protein [Xanthomonadaceae bacterium]|nr:secretin and TonB N-terminal domain-containing protein [Xanthomonadaceae bacterium]
MKTRSNRFPGAMVVVVVAVMLGIAAAPGSAHAVQGSARAVAKQSVETTTFNFSNIPVRSALQLISEQGHFNLIVSDSVQGTVSIHLVNVTWEQALDIVLRLKGLHQHIDGNTRSVSAAAE